MTIQPEDVAILPESRDTELLGPDHASNVLTGVIIAILQMKAKVQIIIDVGFPIKSEIPLRPFIDLNLMEGTKVYVQFKVNVSKYQR